jgi:hypothetical protein
MSQIDSTEARLTTHEEICSLRYAAIELQMKNIDERFDRLNSDIKEIKESNAKSTSEIKIMLNAAKDEKFKVMITSTTTLIVGLLGMLGYLVLQFGKLNA